MIWEALSTGGRLRNSHSEAVLGVEYAKDDSRVVRYGEEREGVPCYPEILLSGYYSSLDLCKNFLDRK
jgi:hypothetical protein